MLNCPQQLTYNHLYPKHNRPHPQYISNGKQKFLFPLAKKNLTGLSLLLIDPLLILLFHTNISREN